MDKRSETKKIILHCSDGRAGNAESIRRYHMDPPPQGRGWEDIGYHFVINYDGSLEKGRDESLVGSHCQGDNHDSIGVCIIGAPKPSGQFDCTADQLAKLKSLCINLSQKYSFGLDQVYGHYEMKSGIEQGKTCPDLNMVLLRSYIKCTT